MEFEPKEHGFPGINIICSECGAMFSERSGHKCSEYRRRKDGYY